LTFGEKFNQPLGYSLLNLINLQKIIFGKEFNKPLGDSLLELTNLRELTLGENFNQHINIPGWIKKLVLNCDSQSIIDYLLSSIVELIFGLNFNLELNDLPSSIKKIIIKNPDYDKKLNNLPNQIETLEISKYCEKLIVREYKNLNVVYL